MNKKILIFRTISTLALVLWIWFIFGNSAEVAEVSARKSGAIASWFVGIITERTIRKMAHLFEYTVLGILLSFNGKLYYKLNKLGTSIILVSGLCIASVDEMIQLTSSGRSAQISDVVLDFSGVIFGVLMLFFAMWIFNKKSRKETE